MTADLEVDADEVLHDYDGHSDHCDFLFLANYGFVPARDQDTRNDCVVLPWVGLVSSSSLSATSSVVELCKEQSERGEAMRFEVQHDMNYLSASFKQVADERLDRRQRQQATMVRSVARGELRTLAQLASYCGLT